MDEKDKRKDKPRRGRHEHSEPVEVMCPKCHYTRIVYLPREEIPRCEKCDKQMVVKEVLTEGKSY